MSRACRSGGVGGSSLEAAARAMAHVANVSRVYAATGDRERPRPRDPRPALHRASALVAVPAEPLLASGHGGRWLASSCSSGWKSASGGRSRRQARRGSRISVGHLATIFSTGATFSLAAGDDGQRRPPTTCSERLFVGPLWESSDADENRNEQDAGRHSAETTRTKLGSRLLRGARRIALLASGSAVPRHIRAPGVAAGRCCR